MALTVLIVFFAGCFGAAMGAVGVIVITAMVVGVGIVSAAAGVEYDLISQVAFGVVLGPHVSFAPAVCAAGFAKRMGYMDNGMDIVKPLISLDKPIVLAVGGLFALLGYFVNNGIAHFCGGGIDSVATTIVVISIVAKVLFSMDSGLEKLIGAAPESVKAIGGRFSARNKQFWFPYQASGSMLLLYGISVGVLSAFVTVEMLGIAAATGNQGLAAGAVFPGWTIGIISFAFIMSGCAIPVTHHIALPASLAAMLSFNATNGDVQAALLWAAALGVFGAHLGSLWGRGVTSYGQTYIDPPSAAIAIASVFTLTIFPRIDAYSPASGLDKLIPIAILAAGVIIAIIHMKTTVADDPVAANA